MDLSQPIAITAGEPAGIGPELIAKLTLHKLKVPLVYVGDPALIATEKNIDLPIIPIKTHVPVTPGILNSANSAYVLACLERATKGALNGEFSAIVTGPVHKGIINSAGTPFSGQTEFIAAECGDHLTPIMMLCYQRLRVALVTTHLPLAKVSAAITSERVRHCIETVYADLKKRFKIRDPKIAVCGLNPHAGEQGYLGREEIDIIEPVIQTYQQRGWQINGPLPADSVFAPPFRQEYDAIIAMYHDQGLTALKALGFHAAVNVTLGLPIIRTSVDHGTALDLAGKGVASVTSLLAAVELAVELAMNGT